MGRRLTIKEYEFLIDFLKNAQSLAEVRLGLNVMKVSETMNNLFGGNTVESEDVLHRLTLLREVIENMYE